MRKLLILMLVLGMASMANAAFTLVVDQTGVGGVAPADGSGYYDPVDSQLELLESEYLWVGIHNDTQGVPGAAQKGIFWMAMLTDPQAQWTGQFVKYYQPGGALAGPTPDNTYYGTTDAGTGDGLIDLWNLNMSDGSPGTFNNVGVFDAKELHCEYDEAYPVEIILFDAGFVELDRIQIHQIIPEPMTMVLLGLGGLLLRRRK